MYLLIIYAPNIKKLSRFHVGRNIFWPIQQQIYYSKINFRTKYHTIVSKLLPPTNIKRNGKFYKLDVIP